MGSIEKQKRSMQNYTPDFLITPYEVHSHEGLRPSDSTIYAVVYWFERMKDGKCTAGNDTIARVACLKERTIGAGLERLEQFGFIERVYEDEGRTKRLEIRTLVHMTRNEKEATPRMYKAKAGKIRKQDIKPGAIIITDEHITKEPTPGELARDFFAPPGTASAYRDTIIDELVGKTGVEREALIKEIRKFYIYWTEPTKSGKKQLWETKETFEVKRRLYTWLSRAGKYNGAGARKGSGAGATI